VEGEWLSSQHIAACNTLLRSMYPGQNGLQDTCLLEQRGVWASKSEGFVQIIHVSPDHWVCLSNKFSPEGTVDLFDSLHTVPLEDGSIVAQACCIMHTPESILTVNVVSITFQEGGSDCGLFAIAMAYDLCAGVDPVSRKYQQEQMRSHLHSCISSKQLKPFPSQARDVPKRTLGGVSVEVHCFCRQPEGGKWMVCCDGCQTWYHEGCVPIPEDVRNDTEDEFFWQCPQCEGTSTIFITCTVYMYLFTYVCVNCMFLGTRIMIQHTSYLDSSVGTQSPRTSNKTALALLAFVRTTFEPVM